MRVYIEGWDKSANEARRLAASAGVDVASTMDGDITHLVVGYGVRMKASHHAFTERTGVPLLGPDEFRALVTGDAGEVRPLGEVKTGPPKAEPAARSRHWSGPSGNGLGPKEAPNTMWVWPLFTCGAATPFLLAHLAAKTASWRLAGAAVVYGFLLGFGLFAVGAGEPMSVYGTVMFVVATLAGTIHVGYAFHKHAVNRVRS